MDDNLLSKYIGVFGNLHRNVNPKMGRAPHKPVLLLALLDQIERGLIPDNIIVLTQDLVAAFSWYWDILVPEGTWVNKIANPFRFMVQDGFWELVKNGIPVSTQSLGNNPTIRQLTIEVDGACLAPDLWELLQDRMALQTLRTHMLRHYFNVGLVEIQTQIPANPIDYEVEKLKAEAQSQFRPHKVREESDETGYFMRHALFPRVIRDLYRNACAVCGISPQAEDSRGLIDAAHIMPFGLYHNDDPRNGIALCKNHHWGFDAGWYSITNDYHILVSPKLRHNDQYIITGVPLLLPQDHLLAPALSALSWHRKSRFIK